MLFRSRGLSARDEPVELGWTDDGQPLVMVLVVQCPQDRLLTLAVRAPMGPEKEQHDFAFQVIRRRWLYAEVVVDFESRKRLAFYAEQEEVLLNSSFD